MAHLIYVVSENTGRAERGCC